MVLVFSLTFKFKLTIVMMIVIFNTNYLFICIMTKFRYEFNTQDRGYDKYTFKKNLKTKNKELMLHSYKIKFIINNTKYTFKALLPNYFKKLIKTKRLNF